MNFFRYCLLSLCLCLISFSSLLAKDTLSPSNLPPKPSFRSTGTPPPGFEDLLAPKTATFTITYQGEQLTTATVTYSINEIIFKNPQAVIKQLPDLIDTTKISQALSQPLSANSALVCLSSRNCKSLTPDVVGVIADIDQFQIKLFINSKFLVQKNRTQQFLPSSKSGFSLLQDFGFSYSGVIDKSNNYNLRGNTLLAYNNTRIESLWSISKAQIFFVDTLALVHEHKQYQSSLGMIRTPGSLLLGEYDLLGAGLTTFLSTRTDLKTVFGSELLLFLPLRSQVDIIKDGRLIASHFYDAGNQVLDTHLLPDGAYNIELNIRDSSGQQRTETRFYSKTSQMPPSDQAFYIAQFGLIEKQHQTGQYIAEYSDNWLLRLGTTHRVTDYLGLGMSVFGSNDEWLFKGNTTLLIPYLELNAEALVSTEQDYGYALNARLFYQSLSLNINARQLWQGKETNTEHYFDPINESSSQFSLTGNYFSRPFDTRFRAQLRDSDNSDIDWSLSPGITLHIVRNASWNLDFDTDYTQTNLGYEVRAQFKLLYRKQGFNNQSRLGVRSLHSNNTSGTTEPVASTRLQWDDNHFFPGRLTTSIGAEKEISQDSVGGDIEYRSTQGRAQLAIEQVWNKNNSDTLYATNLSFGFAANTDGFSVGGYEANRSGVIIRLTGSKVEGDFNVLIDDQARITVSTGKDSLVLLNPYRTYKIRLLPKNVGLVNFDESTRYITLYPGNIDTLDWEINTIYVLFSQITDTKGQVLSHAKVEGAAGFAITDNEGFLQAELKSNTKDLSIKPENKVACKVQLPEINPENGIVVLDKLICR
ncbi:MAG: hypothetical protein GQ529_00155 [Methyloprofundus sp.]|nr:hypothetical protein [Methyloprofundus sp.]